MTSWRARRRRVARNDRRQHDDFQPASLRDPKARSGQVCKPVFRPPTRMLAETLCEPRPGPADQMVASIPALRQSRSCGPAPAWSSSIPVWCSVGLGSSARSRLNCCGRWKRAGLRACPTSSASMRRRSPVNNGRDDYSGLDVRPLVLFASRMISQIGITSTAPIRK